MAETDRREKLTESVLPRLSRAQAHFDSRNSSGLICSRPSEVPLDVLVCILEYLDEEELQILKLVCRRFNEVIISNKCLIRYYDQRYSKSVASHVYELKWITRLDLYGSFITDEQLLRFSDLHLTGINLGFNKRLTKGALIQLFLSQKQLQYLGLANSREVDAEVLQVMCSHHKDSLRVLDLEGCTGVSRLSSFEIGMRCENLQELSLARCNDDHLDVLYDLANVNKLQNLRLLEYGPTWNRVCFSQQYGSIARLIGVMDRLLSLKVVGLINCTIESNSDEKQIKRMLEHLTEKLNKIHYFQCHPIVQKLLKECNPHKIIHQSKKCISPLRKFKASRHSK